MKARKHGSIYNRLLILFSLTVIPFILIGTWILLTLINQYRNQVLTMEYAKTQNAVEQFDNSIDDIFESCHYLLGQSDILKLSNAPDQFSIADQISSVHNLYEQLTNIASANSYAEYLRIYIRKMNRVFNSTGYLQGSFQDITAEDYLNLFESAQNEHVQYSTKNQISIFITTGSPSSGSSVLEILLSPRSIKEYFSSLTVGSDDYFLLKSKDGTFTLHNIPFDYDDNTFEYAVDALPYADEISLNNDTYLLFAEDVPSIKCTFYRVISRDLLFAPLQFMTIYLCIFFLIIFIGIICFFVIARHMIHTPITRLVAGLSEIENGNYDVQISYHKKNEFSYLYHGFNVMAANLKSEIEQNYQNRLLLQQAELKQLQAQINPHFLYNSFFMLQRTIQAGLNDEAVEITSMLGKYFQYITRNSMDFVNLKDEYMHARIYSQIQGLRFEGRIQISFDDLPSSCEWVKVPKLILQPLIENTFQYAFNDMITGGIVRVQISCTDTEVQISIDDNGNALNEEALKELIQRTEQVKNGLQTEMHGMLNICRRLCIFTGNKNSFSIQRSDLGGLSIFLSIPIITTKEDTHDPNADCR